MISLQVEYMNKVYRQLRCLIQVVVYCNKYIFAIHHYYSTVLNCYGLHITQQLSLSLSLLMSGDEIIIEMPTTTTVAPTMKPQEFDKTAIVVMTCVGVLVCSLVVLLCIKNRRIGLSRRSTGGSTTLSIPSTW